MRADIGRGSGSTADVSTALCGNYEGGELVRLGGREDAAGIAFAEFAFDDGFPRDGTSFAGFEIGTEETVLDHGTDFKGSADRDFGFLDLLVKRFPLTAHFEDVTDFVLTGGRGNRQTYCICVVRVLNGITLGEAIELPP